MTKGTSEEQEKAAPQRTPVAAGRALGFAVLLRAP